MKKTLLILITLFPLTLFAQQKDTSAANLVNKQRVSNDPFRHPLSFQLQGGTQGVGADVRYGVLPRLSVRAGASFIPITANNAFSLSEFKSDNSVTAKFSNAHLLADFALFKGLRLVGGGAYLFKANGGLNVVPTGSYKYGDIAIPPADIGKLNFDVNWKGFAPYLGLGLFKSFPNHVFNINLDLGAYYLSQPKVAIVGTGLLDNNAQNESVVAGNLKDYRFLPVLQLNFNFKIR